MDVVVPSCVDARVTVRLEMKSTAKETTAILLLMCNAVPFLSFDPITYSLFAVSVSVQVLNVPP